VLVGAGARRLPDRHDAVAGAAADDRMGNGDEPGPDTAVAGQDLALKRRQCGRSGHVLVRFLCPSPGAAVLLPLSSMEHAARIRTDERRGHVMEQGFAGEARRTEQIPAVTAAEMAAVDRAMVERLGLDILQVMEVAGWAVARFARDRFLGGNPRGRSVLILAGGGGNGGDGMVAARYLHGWGADVRVLLDRAPDRLGQTAAHQAAILGKIGPPSVPVGSPGGPRWPVEPPARADLLIDALFGFTLSRDPDGPSARLIHLANAAPGPILAVDLPSGLDATAGTAYNPAVRATATLTLALPKTGLLSSGAVPYLGELYLADIGVPRAAYRLAGVDEERIDAAATCFDRAATIRIIAEAGDAAGTSGGRSGDDEA
jgi:NAD(P)H-hydrate epimerase